MSCATGSHHTIALSDDGSLHSFGDNIFGQLGLGHTSRVSVPSQIPNIPKICMVSCGSGFAVCVDYEGSLWSFGKNDFGQLGTGNTNYYDHPQKISGFSSPIQSISCGGSHTLILTSNNNLWSCGSNELAQLCLRHTNDQSTPQKTQFSDVTKISAGLYYSFFQTNIGDIYACGSNSHGQLGLGHFNSPKIEPCLIIQARDIVEFCAARNHSLFLDIEGNVYSVGLNTFGSLGIGHNTDQNILQKIINIPPIKIISCVDHSSYLVDLDGNLWSFGQNNIGQLLLGDTKNRNVNVPTKINSVANIKQISHGCASSHFLLQDSQNTIFVAGKNEFGQLNLSGNNTRTISTPKELTYDFSIWGYSLGTNKAKSARK